MDTVETESDERSSQWSLEEMIKFNMLPTLYIFGETSVENYDPDGFFAKPKKKQ